jgi:hypothetical protein
MLIESIDRHARRRPFANWMKRLANLKTLHADSNNANSQQSSDRSNSPSKTRKTAAPKNNPYPLSSRTNSQNGHLSYSEPTDPSRSGYSSVAQSKRSFSPSRDSQFPQKSRPPTLATTAETAISDVAPSGAGTSATAPRTDGDRNSTFSSPAPSVRSMTTTLTTVQSTAPPLNTAHSTGQIPHSSAYPAQPATAVPAHLAPHMNPTTYSSATANNVLTDDASILTLASSSKRRRRNSVDTNASVKAIPPASMFGGSRESLPLSVLSGTIIHGQPDNASIRDVSSPYPATATSSKLNPERASLISASGVAAPALASERNSYIGSKYGDAASVRSGLLGGGSGLHGRNDSISGSIGGLMEPKEKEREKEKE